MSTELARRSAELRRLVRDMPLAKERELVELVSDAAVITALNDARGREPFFRRLVGAVTGADRRNQVEITSRLLGRQRSMESWMRELSDQGAVTDLAIAQMAGHLRAVQHQLAHVERVAEQALYEVRELAGIVAELAREVDARLGEHDRRLDEHQDRIVELERRLLRTELWQSAWAGFDRSVRRWESRGAYGSAAFAYQVALLAREVARGPCGVHEFVARDAAWRDRLVERVLADPRVAAAWPASRSLDDVLDEAWQALPTTDHRSMVAELLGAGLPADLSTPDGELSKALVLSMELAARRPDIRPVDVGRTAVDTVLRRAGYLPTGYTVGAFVRRVVDEQADGAQEALHRLRGDAAAAAENAGAPDGRS
jgi:hypothetical protein